MNRYITSRLPLCLPPRAFTPQVYAAGLGHFAAIFFAFEDAWDNLPPPNTEPKHSIALDDTWDSLGPLSASTESGEEDRLLPFLRTLRPEGIARSERLRNDFALLGGARELQSGDDTEKRHRKAVENFRAHIEDIIKEKPYLLIAYAWTMYMAVFSGGRWIRAQLCATGEDFWTGKSQHTLDETAAEGHENAIDTDKFEALGLSFWFFPGNQDGEDIKAEFKLRLQEGEEVLTSSQRSEIVAEAREIFTRCDALVRELDAMHAGPDAAAGIRPDTQSATGKSRSQEDVYLYGMPGYAGLALVVSCVSWYAMYHAGTWS